MFEDDDTRREFLQEDEHAVEAWATPTGGEAFKFIGIFDRRPLSARSVKGAQVGYDEGAQVTGNSPQIRCLASDAEAIRPGRCIVHAEGVDYNVFDKKDDYTGLVLLVLKVA